MRYFDMLDRSRSGFRQAATDYVTRPAAPAEIEHQLDSRCADEPRRAPSFVWPFKRDTRRWRSQRAETLHVTFRDRLKRAERARRCRAHDAEPNYVLFSAMRRAHNPARTP